MDLTPKQRAFADYYIELGNATEAYKKAGYKNYKSAAVEANKTLNNPKIKAYISERMNKIEDGRIAKADEVLKYLTTVMRGEHTEEVIVVESVGDFMSEARVIDKQVSARERIKAAELLGKRYKLFTDKMEVEGNVGVKIIDDIEADTDE